MTPVHHGRLVRIFTDHPRTWWAVAIAAFLATRLVFLDRDVPSWDLAMYQPIDEFEYVLPAFNLHHYGTWVHQEVPYAAIEGAPMNVAQSVVTFLTLQLDWSYWGLRLSSVLFGLFGFLAMMLTARILVRRGESDGVSAPFPVRWLLPAIGVLLLADFSFLMGGRVIEPTIARLAYLAVIVWLVARGTFLGPSHGWRRSLVLGIVAGAGVLFVYVYNAFFVPGVLIAVVAWAYPRGRRAVIGHLGAVAAGTAIAVVVYFTLVFAVYGHGPAEWYGMWLRMYRDTGRADAIDLGQLWTLLQGNIFRLDRPLMLVTLLVLPAFVWWAFRARDQVALLVLGVGMAFVAQSIVQSDYPPRKMLILLPLVVPVVVGGLLRFGAWRTWITGHRLRLAGALAWGAAVIGGTLLTVLPPDLIHWQGLVRLLHAPPADQMSYRVGADGLIVAAGALVGTAAIVLVLFAWNRCPIARAASLVLVVAVLAPLAWLDAAHVLLNPTTGYRDAMIAAKPLVDGRVTAGEWSFAMQLYNTSRPVVQGYLYESTREEYERALVRYCLEHDVAATFGYAHETSVERLAGLGFTLVETYPIPLPRDRVMGRYVFDPANAPAP